MVTNLRVPRGPTAAAREQAQQYLNRASTSAAEAVDTAETFVRDHPASAVWTVFLFGLLFGAAAGWLSAERYERRWYDDLEGKASRLRSRFHW